MAWDIEVKRNSGAGATRLVAVLPNHRFDEAALLRYLRGKLPGFEGDMLVSQFQGGQSNPTYHLQTPAGAWVLRKKPTGKLLPSAHAVDREYRVMKALAGSAAATSLPSSAMRDAGEEACDSENSVMPIRVTPHLRPKPSARVR